MDYLNEIITNLIFFLEYAVMLSVFVRLFERRSRIGLRYGIFAAISVCLILGLAAINTYIPGWKDNELKYTVTMAVLTVYNLVWLVVCYHGTVGSYIFHFLSVVILIEAISSARQICTVVGKMFMDSYADSWLDRIITIAITVICALGAYVFVRGFEKNKSMQIDKRYIALYIVICVVLFIISYIADSVEKTWVNILGEVGVILCMYIFLFMQYVIFLQRKEEIRAIRQESERTIAEQTARQSLQLYNELKANMDIINIKCHDLKHKINNLSRGQAFDEEEIKEIQSSIDMYNCNIRTGNEYLDVVLSNKSLLATEQKITIMPVADGAKLDFMSPADIYSLFGNALDNAMEYVATLDEQDRIIRLTVKGAGDFVSICVENPFTGELVLKDGVPVTHKDDKQNHGFGVKSMRHIAEKYSGDLQIEAEGGFFRVKILVERPEPQPSAAA